MFKKGLILLLAGIFLLGATPLYPLQPLSLDDILKEAKEKSPELLAAKKRWEAALARIPQAKSLDNPTLGFAFEKIPGSPFRLDKTMSEDRMLSVSQFFPLFGKLSLKGKIALVESQMVATEYKAKELEIVNEVKNSYYDLFMNYKEIELDRQSLEFLRNIAKIAETRYSIGDISQEGVFKVQLEIARLSTDIVNLKEENRAKQTRLNTLLNRAPESPLGIPYLDEDASFTVDTKSLYQSTLLSQPELVIFSYAIERNKYAKSLAKKSFFPDLMAQITERGFTMGTIGPWDLMLAFTVPLWFWTKQRYEVKEAIANLEEAEAAYKAMENRAFNEVKGLAAKIESAKNKIKLYKNNLMPILESSIASDLAGFRSDKMDFMILLDNERMLIETQMNYYKSLVDYNMNLADLERAVGKDLKEVKK